MEFRTEFTLRRDHRLRPFTVKVEADAGQTDGERELLISVVFDEIEETVVWWMGTDGAHAGYRGEGSGA